MTHLKPTCRMSAGPLKELPEFEAYRTAELRLQSCIVERFDLPPEQPVSVTAADNWMLAIEIRDLMVTGGRYSAPPPEHVAISVTEPLPPAMAEREFLTRFKQLFPQ
jgi:hypothetical protein